MKETSEEGARVNSGFGCERNCCVVFVYRRHRSKYGARRTRVVARYTFADARYALPSVDSVPEGVCAVVVVLGILPVLHYRMSIVGRVTRDGHCRIWW